MADPRTPGVEPRRRADLLAELLARARLWLPEWTPASRQGDAARALLDVSAGLLSRTAERLDQMAEKNRRNLALWLGLRGAGARGARLPLVLKLGNKARKPTYAPPATQLQAESGGVSLVFETESALQLVPASVAQVVAVDLAGDHYYLPPPGLSSLEATPALPVRWALVSDVDEGARTLQLDPPLGLVAGMSLLIAGRIFRVLSVQGDIVTIDPELDVPGGLVADRDPVRALSHFAPFDELPTTGTATTSTRQQRDRQTHALYFGHDELLKIESPTEISVLQGLPLKGHTWQYWGKAGKAGPVDWQALSVSEPEGDNPDNLLLLTQAEAGGSFEALGVGGSESRWIRAKTDALAPGSQPLVSSAYALMTASADGLQPAKPPVLEGFCNTNPLVLTTPFYPLGREPRQFDTFYLGCAEVFSKHGARVELTVTLADGALQYLSGLDLSATRDGSAWMMAGVALDHTLRLLDLNPASGALRFLNPPGALQPPLSAGIGRVALSSKPGLKPVMWRAPVPTQPELLETRIAVVDDKGRAVWVWSSIRSWLLPNPAALSDGSSEISGITGLCESGGELFACAGGVLYRDAGSAGGVWRRVVAEGDPSADIDIRAVHALAPGGSSVTLARRLIGVPEQGTGGPVLQLLDLTDPKPAWQRLVPNPVVPGRLLVDVPLVSMLDAASADTKHDTYVVAMALKVPAAALAVRLKLDKVDVPVILQNAPAPAAGAIDALWTRSPTLASEEQLTGLEIGQDGGQSGGRVRAALAIKSDDAPRMQFWWPDFSIGAVQSPLDLPLQASDAQFIGNPLRLGKDLFTAGSHGIIYQAPWSITRQAALELWVSDPALRTFLAPPKDKGPSGIHIISFKGLSWQVRQDSLDAPDWTVPGANSSTSYLRVVVQQDGAASDTALAESILNFPLTAATTTTVQVTPTGTTPSTDRLIIVKPAGIEVAKDTYLGFRIEPSSDRLEVRQVKEVIQTPQPDKESGGDAAIAVTASGTSAGAPPNAQATAAATPSPPETLEILLSDTIDISMVPAGTPIFFGQPKAATDSAFLMVMPVATVRPPVSLEDMAPNTTKTWVFPAARPTSMRVTLLLNASNEPAGLRLQPLPKVKDWDPPAGIASGQTEFLADVPIDEVFQVNFRSVESNPDLAWEYSAGRSWQALTDLEDTTLALKCSGSLSFTVPDDMAPTDWAGRTNSWLRARLIGGDYGKEQFLVRQTAPVPFGELDPPTGTESTQTIERQTTGVQPPLVADLGIRYRLDTAVPPQYLVAEDAGTLRRLGDANRIEGAVVESFVPLATALGRLGVQGQIAADAASPPTGDPATQGPAAGSAPAGCDCGCSGGTSATAGTAAAGAATAASAEDYSLFIGIDGPVLGTPVHLFIAVAEERDLDVAAPLRVEALVEGRFEPVTVEDGTRALGESGLLVLDIGRAPTVTELFGRSLSWLRLSVARPAGWRPSIAGVWLNAVWAQAAQTQSFELLGSARGEPGLVVHLARPPLLRGTLELRVDEPLGEEEIAALRRGDESTVLTQVEGLPGCWVRWQAVDDPDDAPADARVYGVEDDSGAIRFGDGLHGMIPPIGRNNLVAFRYRRTEPLRQQEDGSPVAPLAVSDRQTLSLITPLEGVEAAVAVLDADSGQAPDDAARILRFAPEQLRHRGRGLTPRDLEALALQAQPALAQARCRLLPDGLRLVLAMRGSNPVPPRALTRAVRDLLRQQVAPVLLAPGRRFEVVGVRPRALVVTARLTLASLAAAGPVNQALKTRWSALFDSAHGGDDGLGWAIARNPRPEDLGALSLDLPGLLGLEPPTFSEATDDQGPQAWPAQLGPEDLVVLAADGLDMSYVVPALTA